MAPITDAFIRRGSENPERNEYGCKVFHTMHLHICKTVVSDKKIPEGAEGQGRGLTLVELFF